MGAKEKQATEKQAFVFPAPLTRKRSAQQNMKQRMLRVFEFL